MAETEFGPDRRTPEQIERELEQTRSDIGRIIEAIQYKITPGQLINDAYAHLRDGGGDFAKNLGAAVKNNPVPVALVGLGLAWLMTGRGTPAYLQRSGATSDASFGFESGTSFGDAIGGLGRSVGGSGTSERVRRMSEDVRSLAAEWAGEAGELAQAARDQAHHASDAVQGQSVPMQENASQMLRDQPLVAGALGIAIGAVLGALLPLSRREEAPMGETRDRSVTDAAADAAKNETGTQDLTSGGSTEGGGEQWPDGGNAGPRSGGPAPT